MTMTMTLMATMTDDDDDDLDVAHSHSGSSSTTPYQIIEIWKCNALRRGENLRFQRKTSRRKLKGREPTTNPVHMRHQSTPGFESRPHFLWETSAFAIMPPLLPLFNLVCTCVIHSKRKPFHADL